MPFKVTANISNEIRRVWLPSPGLLNRYRDFLSRWYGGTLEIEYKYDNGMIGISLSVYQLLFRLWDNCEGAVEFNDGTLSRMTFARSGWEVCQEPDCSDRLTNSDDFTTCRACGAHVCFGCSTETLDGDRCLSCANGGRESKDESVL